MSCLPSVICPLGENDDYFPQHHSEEGTREYNQIFHLHFYNHQEKKPPSPLAGLSSLGGGLCVYDNMAGASLNR